MRNRPVTYLSVIAALGLVAFVAAPAALAKGGSMGSVSEFYGSFGTEVPLVVPKFHGIEPKLGLSASSDTSNGFAGVGWNLDGFSVIERASPGRGAPTYQYTGGTCQQCPDICYGSYGIPYECGTTHPCNCYGGTDRDIFLMDGQELVACDATMTASPSCATGGTHAGKIENFLKIQQDGPNNKWYVWSKDGTKLTYSPIMSTYYHAFRWGLTEVRNTNNQYVTYVWDCTYTGLVAGDCYPSQVNYNANKYVVDFYRDTRPDPLHFTTGDRTMGLTNQRLAAVSVKVNGAMARAYKLTYDANGRHGKSFVTSLQEFGTNAVVTAEWTEDLDGDGIFETVHPTTVTGSALPAKTFGRAAGALDMVSTYKSGLYFNTNGLWTYPGDYDGDGKDDLMSVQTTGWGTAIIHINWGKGGKTTYSDAHINSNTKWQYIGDFNGDGRADILAVYATGWGTGKAYLSSFSTAGVKSFVYYSTLRINGTPEWNRVGDFNGDGKDDLLAVYATGWGTGKAYVNYVVDLTYLYDADMHINGSNTWLFTGDFNGDGKADVFSVYTAAVMSGVGYVHFMNEAVTGFDPAYVKNSMYINATAYWNVTGDFNGDGKTDIACINAPANNADRNLYIYVNYGSGHKGDWPMASYIGASVVNNANRLHVGDFNGDGISDIMSIVTTGAAGKAWVNYMTGGGLFADMHEPMYIHATDALNWVGDFNGDGRDDLASYYSASAGYFMYQTGPLEQVSCVGNGAGGTSTFAYTPSSAWTNTNSPPVVQTLTSETLNDGRGNTSTTTYSYSGGLYDRQERRFLGFNYAKMISPCIDGESSCPYVETNFSQDYGSLSKPTKVWEKSGSGATYTYEYHYYSNNGTTIPYKAWEYYSYRYNYNGGSSYKRNLVYYYYDTYGNLTQERDYGDHPSTGGTQGDEKTTYVKFYPNTGAYIVNKRAYVNVYAGVGTAGTLLSQVLNYYDGQTSYTVAPTKGNLTWERPRNISNSAYVDLKTEYDTYGNVTKRTGATTGASTAVYDSTYHLFPTTTTNALGHQVIKTVNAACQKEATTKDANGQTTTHYYDVFCRITKSSGPLGSYVRHVYGSFGTATAQNVLTYKNAANGTTEVWARKYFDGLGRTWRVEAKGVSANVRQDTDYDARGNVERKSAPYFVGGTIYWDTPLYDPINRVTRLTHADNTYGTVTYGLDSRTFVDESGHKRVQYFNYQGKVSIQREYVDATVYNDANFDYDLLGRITRVRDHNGTASDFYYDTLGRKTKSVDKNLGTWTYLYDAAGHTTKVTDAKGQVTSYYYDLIGRKTKKVAGSATYTWTYDTVVSGYYNKGNLTATTFPGGSSEIRYDAQGRPVYGKLVVDGVSYVTQRGYDGAGRMLWTTLPDGDTVGTSTAPLLYDVAGRLTAIPGYVTAALYDAAGRLTSLTYANGNVTTRAYSANRGFLTQIKTLAGATVRQQLDYSYDAEGRISKILSTAANEDWAYYYDGRHRLTRADNLNNNAYDNNTAFNAIDNITSTTRLGAYSYTDAAHIHAVTAAPSSPYTYTYDANGNMATGAGRSFTWDVDNRPTNISGATFAYDADGNRVKKVEGGVTTVYVGSHYQKDGATITKYVNLGDLPVAKKVGSTKYYLHVDHLGSVNVITDSAGAEVLRRSYRSWGETLANSTSHVEAVGFTGARLDATGLYYMNARYYDPILQRFVSPDPTMSTSANVGLNRYAYAGNDPINHIDSDGLGLFSSIKKFFKKVFKAIKKLFKAALKLIIKVLRAIPGVRQLLDIMAGLCRWLADIVRHIPLIGGWLALGLDVMYYYYKGDFERAWQLAKIFVAMTLLMAAVIITIYITGPLVAGWMGAFGETLLGQIAANFIAGYVTGFVCGYLAGAALGVGSEMSLQMALVSGASTAWVGAANAVWGPWMKASWNAIFKGGSASIWTHLGAWVPIAGLVLNLKGFKPERDYYGPSPDGKGYKEGPYAIFGGRYGNNLLNALAFIHDKAAERAGYADNTGYNNKMAWDWKVQFFMIF